MRSRYLYIILLGLIPILPLSAQYFYFGADLSYVNEMEDCGAEYKVDNNLTDPYQIFSENGTNLVRLRLWHTPSWYDNLNEGNRYSDFEDVRLSIMRAKAEGMEVLLDFHLSDRWADPGHQVIPAAWASVVNDLEALQDSLYNYIYSTLNKLALEGLLPELVQIGNETNRGILLSQQVNDMGWSMDWARNSALFNSAIAAVHDIESVHQSEIKIALHIAGPDDIEWYIGQFHDHGVTDFDIIGLSYYWQWHENTFAEVGEVIASLKTTYPEKEVMILETAYPWTTVNADGANNILSVSYPGYSPFSPANQKNWLVDLTQTVIDNGGRGIVYWEPAWVSTDCFTLFAQGSSWDNATFFNSNHNLINNGGIGWMAHPYDFATGTTETFITSNFKIYSDKDKLYIRLENEDPKLMPTQLDIYDVNGRIIFKQVVKVIDPEEELSIDVDMVPGGCYLIRLGRSDLNLGSQMIFIY